MGRPRIGRFLSFMWSLPFCLLSPSVSVEVFLEADKERGLGVCEGYWGSGGYG